jgi:catechol 2,3-dioxygenase-like lactoylglutathione lyase family enzyme
MIYTIVSSLLAWVASSTLVPLAAQEDRDWKKESWYDPKLYPDAPYIRPGTYNQKPLQGKLLRVKRPLLIVADLERSLKFYADVLGLEVYSIDPYYNRDPKSLGYEMFGIPLGARKRMAMLNTSDEVRGITLQEVKDMRVEFRQRPRSFTILFETDDLLGIRQRAKDNGFRFVEPLIEEIPATASTPRLRFMEFGVLDPDDHVVAFFQYFDSDDDWRKARQAFAEIKSTSMAPQNTAGDRAQSAR